MILRPLIEAGKGRTAGRLRAYLRAAYALAARAEVDPDAPAAFLSFRVDGNPVAVTGSACEVQSGTRPYVERARAACVLRGAHRCAGLANSRCTVAGAAARRTTNRPIGARDRCRRRRNGEDATSVRSEGPAPATPRSCAAAARTSANNRQALHRSRRGAASEGREGRQDRSVGIAAAVPVLDIGGAPLRPETLTNAVTGIVAALRAKPKAERIVKDPFQLRDIRRTCETRLAALGISRDLRAQIQSHGLGGVQAKHYDRHAYMPEKAAALAAWVKYLETAPAANVAHIGERRARRG